MDDGFSIDVIYKGKELTFEVRLAAVGYTHKFYVMVNDTEVIYEPDEERNYRAIINDISKFGEKDKELIKVIAAKLEEAAR